MKKFLTLILAVCAVGLSSCKIDDLKDLVSLENTTWEGTFSPNEKAPTQVVTYKFAATTWEATATDGSEVKTGKGSYTFIAPILKMTFDESSSKAQGTVSGNKLTIKSPDSNKDLVLTKK